ncbi:MAG TPA: hypothetical protein VFV99_26890 [Kofleriaceae bacterium]|nr:hypothetical protein [Kofleriaceae bacterium]
MRLVAGLLLVTACASEPTLGEDRAELTAAVRHERYGLIRDSAAEMGLYNAALMAGIAISETNLAHCQSEATYACQGPASPSCNGGPIIAGAADGPCADMQGGLGMFQFDAGTYAQTVATYGDSILTIEGNTAQAVNFVVERSQTSIAGIDDWLGAVGWMNGVPMQAGDPKTEEWASFLACRYNGCCTTSATCQSRAAGYRDNAIMAFNEMGADFWRTSDRCAAIPQGGVIDQRSECYLAAGDPRYWHRETGGYDDDREWTGTTSNAAAANFALWIVKTSRASRFSVEVNLDGGTFGTSKQAKYVIVHAGATDEVVVDQTSASGWVSLGEFDFAGTGDEHIMLADNTGEAGATDTTLLFDAVRVLSPDDPGDGGGCCDASGRGGPTALLGFAFVGLLGRRRRAC